MMRLELETAQNGWLENSIPVALSGVDEACRNLHANEEGLRTLTNDIEMMISRLSALPRSDAFFSSLDNTIPIYQPARRSPSRARRRAWQTKARYQKKQCPERLRPWQIERLFEADHFARCIGLPLNAFVTVSWKNTRHGNEDIQQRFQKATKAMGQWMRRRNCPATWIFVHENPGNAEPHFHMLIHIPCGQLDSFKTIGLRWFDALECGVHIRARNGPGDRCLSYMVKGTDFITAHRYGANDRNQGTVDFKRCSWTQNLGAAAHRRIFNQNSRFATRPGQKIRETSCASTGPEKLCHRRRTFETNTHSRER